MPSAIAAACIAVVLVAMVCKGLLCCGAILTTDLLVGSAGAVVAVCWWMLLAASYEVGLQRPVAAGIGCSAILVCGRIAAAAYLVTNRRFYAPLAVAPPPEQQGSSQRRDGHNHGTGQEASTDFDRQDDESFDELRTLSLSDQHYKVVWELQSDKTDSASSPQGAPARGCAGAE